MKLSGPEIKPTSKKPAKQLVIFLHGVGADGNDLISLSDAFAGALPDAHFCSPNAPFRFDMAPPGFASGYQWFSLREYMQNPDIAGSRHLSESLYQGANQALPILNEYIDDKLAALGLKDDSLILIGFSQGTMMALHAALRRKHPCRAVIGYSGALCGSHHLDNDIVSRPPICLIHGAADPVVPPNLLGLAKQSLKAHKVTIETHMRPHLGHGIDPEGVEIARKFIVKTEI